MKASIKLFPIAWDFSRKVGRVVCMLPDPRSTESSSMSGIYDRLCTIVGWVRSPLGLLGPEESARVSYPMSRTGMNTEGGYSISVRYAKQHPSPDGQDEGGLFRPPRCLTLRVTRDRRTSGVLGVRRNRVHLLGSAVARNGVPKDPFPNRPVVCKPASEGDCQRVRYR